VLLTTVSLITVSLVTVLLVTVLLVAVSLLTGNFRKNWAQDLAIGRWLRR
jgi:hypothetical protein